MKNNNFTKQIDNTKSVLYLVTLLVFLPIRNYVYATSTSGNETTLDKFHVDKGNIFITAGSITYQYQYSGKISKPIEIKSWGNGEMDKTIRLSEEIRRVLFDTDGEGTLNFDYLLIGAKITNVSDIIRENTLLTGTGSKFFSNQAIIHMSSSEADKSVFAMAGNNSEGLLFENQSRIFIKKLRTSFLFVGNRIYSDKDAILLYNGDTFSVNSKAMIFEDNNLETSDEGVATLIYNAGSMTFDPNTMKNLGIITPGSDPMEILAINNNKIKSQNISGIIMNLGSLTLSGKVITIMNNDITPTFKFDTNSDDKYSFIIGNAKTMNINLYGDNPSFILANNKMTEGSDGKGVIGIINSSEVNFTNYSNSEAKVILGHDIRDDGDNISIVNFRNGTKEDGSNYTGSFYTNLGTNTTEANTISIETNMTLFLTMNKGKDIINGLKGVGSNSKLHIVEGKSLGIEIDKSSLDDDLKLNIPYIIISGFDEILGYDRLFVKSGTIIYNEDNINIRISRRDKDVSVIFSKDGDLANILKQIAESRNNNYRAISNILVSVDNYNIKHNEGIGTVSSIIASIIDNTISEDDKASIIQTIFPDEPSKIVTKAINFTLEQVNGTITDRIAINNFSNSIIKTDSNDILVVSAVDNNYGNKKNNNTLDIWSKINYNYGYNFNDKTSINFVGLIVGAEYNFINNTNTLGLAYSFNTNIDNGNNSHVGNSLALYHNISINNNINFVTTIVSYGNLQTKGVKSSNNININHNYSTNLVSFVSTFGHNIRLANDDIITPRAILGYSYIVRSTYNNSIGINVDKVSFNIIAPAVGLDYQTFINKAKTFIFRVGINLKYSVNIGKKANVDISFNDNISTLTYNASDINNLSGNLSLGIDYSNPSRPKLKFSSNIYMSYSTNDYINTGINVEGRWAIR